MQVLIVESYGGRDEPVDTLTNNFVGVGVEPALDAVRLKEVPNEATYQVNTAPLLHVEVGLHAPHKAAIQEAIVGADGVSCTSATPPMVAGMKVVCQRHSVHLTMQVCASFDWHGCGQHMLGSCSCSRADIHGYLYFVH